ncbi:VOC family protein [Actinomadura bangladeshensis]|uniref:VOC domain-containing protein n=1 Tax=Actinomadura bangladeshensis TaxID=453573 RepID=A0A4R4P948_9ACTN|nr:VOC family protein [Actinomadura bangladeshensis]TDC16772.1 hypothetical protein E1284_11505 [Actinomadura bangladeshensis]
MNHADFRLSSCALAVHDLDEAVGFYRDVLGFEVHADAGPAGTRRVSVGPPSQPDVRILLQSPGGVRDCAFLDPSGNLLRFTEP